MALSPLTPCHTHALYNGVIYAVCFYTLIPEGIGSGSFLLTFAQCFCDVVDGVADPSCFPISGSPSPLFPLRRAHIQILPSPIGLLPHLFQFTLCCLPVHPFFVPRN